MSDIIKSEDNVSVDFVDIGDGTFARVESSNSFSNGANFNVIGSGKSLTSTGTSVSTILPYDSVSLLAPSCVRVSVTDSGYIRIKETEAAATSTDILINTDDAVLIDVKSKKFISFISVGISATANIQPVSGSSFDIFPSTLNLNFTSSTYKINNTSVQFSSIVNFTRASTASFVGFDGLIKFAPINTPRIDYDSTTLLPKGMLIEESRTNLLTFSDNFGDATWVKTAVPTINSQIAPDGNLTADVINTDGAIAQAFQALTITSGATVTTSFFLKQSGITSVEIVLLSNNNTTPYGRATFDISAGTISVAATSLNGATNASATITPFANGYYRCSVTVTYPAVTAAGVRLNATGATGGFIAWGGQFEVGVFSTSYIPTTSSQATRSTEIAKIDGDNFASFFNKNEGTFYVEAITSPVNSIVQRFFEASSLDQNSRYSMRRNTVGNIGQFFVKNGISQADIFSSQSYAGSAQSKTAAAYKTNDFSIVSDGVLGATDNLGDVMLNGAQMMLGSDSNGASPINGCIKRFIYIAKRLTNSELQAISA